MTRTLAVEVVAALDRAWQEIRVRHSEVPAVVLLLGPSPSRAGARRPRLGHYETLGWALRQPATDLERLRAAQKALDRAPARGNGGPVPGAATELIGLLVEQIYRERDGIRDEVFIASELLLAGAAATLAILLPRRSTRSPSGAGSRTQAGKAATTTTTSS